MARRHSGDYYGPQANIGRSRFNRSHRHKTSFDAGELIPYYLDEVLPGDTFNLKLNAFARILSPLDAPVMDDITLEIDFFFVPCRLVWDNWKYFMGEHDAAGAQDTDYTIPVINTGGTFNYQHMYAYMGVPDGLSTTAESISALPSRCYRLVYNEWYRDQALIDEVTVVTGNGPDSTTYATTILKSAKRHDYFTSALPYLQKGDAEDISAALTNAPIHTDIGGGSDLAIYSTAEAGWREIDADDTQIDVSTNTSSSSFQMYADMSAIGLTVNVLRESLAIQRLLERDARGGTRYNELIKSHFGVTVEDYRVQRPEYLGGGKGFINISPVANTSPVDSINAPDGADWQSGRLAGTGSGTLRAGFMKSFTEHGYVLGILRARGEVTYQQGVDRMWSRSTRTDFYFPELAHLGEQPIYNKELWLAGDATDDNIFGYQERFGEYRFKKSLVSGKFLSDASGSLDYWHLAEDFATQPALNQTFIEDATPMSRITTVTTEPDFIIDGFFDLRCARPMPVRPTPSVLGFGRL